MDQLQKLDLGFMQREKGWSFLKVPCQNWGQKRTPAPVPVPRTPLIMLQILFPIIVVGEASRGATFWGLHFGRFPSPASWAPPGTNWVCRVAQLGPAQGPAYSELGGSFGARTFTGMAWLRGAFHDTITLFLSKSTEKKNWGLVLLYSIIHCVSAGNWFCLLNSLDSIPHHHLPHLPILSLLLP